MSKRTLPGVPQGRPQMSAHSYLSPQALQRWDASIGLRAAADADEDRTITIYDIIGEDWWTGAGFTAKRMAAALRSLGKGPVTVAINSPGGDFFEGLAMYSMLREHPGDVTVKVMGLAASAASLVAMGGDEIQISRAGFFMIHNTWIVAMGNRNDLRDLADQIEPFDEAMADVYAAHTGETPEAMGKLMDRESWIGGAAAVAQGFADSLLPSDQVSANAQARVGVAAVRKLEAALRSSGMSKVEAMRLISEFKSSAGDPAGSGGDDPVGRAPSEPRDEEGAELLATFREFTI
jgi:ATP-dependent Clp protease protease subunit